jgi:phosphoserine phosphatase
VGSLALAAGALRRSRRGRGRSGVALRRRPRAVTFWLRPHSGTPRLALDVEFEKPVADAMPHFHTVIFDCDSTLSALEGIEELASEHRGEVESLTDAAMRGDVALEEVYGRRLDLIRPGRAAVEGLIPRYVDSLVEDAAATVAALLDSGVDVRVVSGGLLPAVLGLARHLGLSDHAVSAVDVAFDEAGQYAGFDRAAPAARAGGKAEIVRAWKAGGTGAPVARGPVMFVGDGATDLEARPEVDLFVAYAGVVARPAVVEAAPVVVRSGSLAPILPLALGPDRPDHQPHAKLYDRGKTLIREGWVEWK